ncbi:1-acyl-sn-glycerol-3-phosphate acyltransferase [Asanoa ishikariensis]|uniref:1-acyl-sn-glycerol-3-phosphate acyltransferases n=1 Tax=Asanoa ishikariensis TaxID=137265 RepID=A0A1H3R3K3_9ACTN|nr:lysophospholipid acyltransferase family protein [Asanoa ishikariensis]GIF64475.1 1-acyl-sn-glycerol-3-phosphate acyltransferase [Asanoa ishikariensis]SDZ19895.1 1-acyl-sn-glycerol-3-phosphate acyltransferases [Asanoa ishikariensis]
MSLWRPRNDCGTPCLDTNDEKTEAPTAIQVLRFVRLLGALVFGALLVPVLPLLTEGGRNRAAKAWGRLTLAALGVRLRLRGRLPRGRALVVANHVSWLDIVALLAVAPGRMLAKVEVRQWPLFGALAASGGTIFIDRDRPKTLPDTVADVAAALRAGAVVTVFPEGTTGCGESVGSFRPAMFQAAIDAGATIVPVTLRYGGPAASFIGDETLWSSVRRVLAMPMPVASVSVAPALHPEPAASRRALARVAQAAVGTPVFVPVPIPVEEIPLPIPVALAA